MTYPTPATPLPWYTVDGRRVSRREITWITPIADTYQGDAAYIVRAANAFPHLVAALEEFLPILERQLASVNPGGAAESSRAFQVASARVERMRHALAIARGEVTP